jgi:hypothetical protein
MPDDSVKPVLPHSAWSEECIRTDDFLGQCISWGTPTEGAQSSMTTDGSGYSWTAAAESQTAVAPNNPDLLPTPGTHVATTEVTKTTQAQIPTSNPSVSQATTAPTLASVGTINEASSNNSNNLSSGAVAGIAIGTLIIGFALAFLAAFFLFKRRSAHRGANVSGAGTGYTSYADSTPELVKGGLGGRHSPYVQVSQTPIPPPPLPKTVEEQVIASLPPAAQDGDVHARITALFEQIHRHIETYYRDVHASITPSMEPELARFGAGDVDMAEMLQNCSSATTALKHALVTYVLGITSSKRGDGGQNLFPEELSGTRHVSGTLKLMLSLVQKIVLILRRSKSHRSIIPPPPPRRLPIYIFFLFPPLLLRHPRSSRALLANLLPLGEPDIVRPGQRRRSRACHR